MTTSTVWRSSRAARQRTLSPLVGLDEPRTALHAGLVADPPYWVAPAWYRRAGAVVLARVVRALDRAVVWTDGLCA